MKLKGIGIGTGIVGVFAAAWVLGGGKNSTTSRIKESPPTSAKAQGNSGEVPQAASAEIQGNPIKNVLPAETIVKNALFHGS